MPDSIGLYIHIPFCLKKCRYCDFYSAIYSEKVYKDYFAALCREIKAWGKRIDRSVDTVYFGGGTPSMLGDDIIPLISEIKSSFNVSDNAEITAECNPGADYSFYSAAIKSGVNRLSFGVQSGSDEMLLRLGRTHTALDAKKAADAARQAGFKNISCDIMIALPESDTGTLKSDVDFICSLNPEHISAYILKIEQNTAFFKWQNSLNLPDEDNISKQYLALCRELKSKGYEHYEISNFARAGKKSRHNLKYWRCEEYLGIGPAAHSFIAGKRFYYPSNIKAFINGNEPLTDGIGGEIGERLMLALRTNDGVLLSDLSDTAIKKAEEYEKAGLLIISGGKITLSDKGMLLSNSIITELVL